MTHRAVAARAGVPLSTTSYFFDSIDELVIEALRLGAAARVADVDAAERVAVLGTGPAEQRVDGVAEAVLGSSRTTQAGLVEYYLASGRQPELRGQVSESLRRLASRVATHLERAGATHARTAADAIVTLGDGATLHRLAKVDTDERAHLASGLRLLLAAAMLSEDEVTSLLARYDGPTDIGSSQATG